MLAVAGPSPGHHEPEGWGEETGSNGDGWAGVVGVSADFVCSDIPEAGSELPEVLTAAKGEAEEVAAWGVTGAKGVSRRDLTGLSESGASGTAVKASSPSGAGADDETGGTGVNGLS